MAEEMIELQTSDKEYSRSTLLKYQGNTVKDDKSGIGCEGEYETSGNVSRFKNGLLHGGTGLDGNEQAAYERIDGHTEYFKNGLLHREDGPAVITNWGNWEEYWNEGNLIKIRAFGTIDKEIIEEGT